jgi:hypothetical protein
MSDWRTCLFDPDCLCDAGCGCRGDLKGFLARHGEQMGRHGEIDRKEFARLVELMRNFLASGDMDMAILTAIRIGQNIQFYEQLPELDIVQRVRRDGYRAAMATWGSEAARKKKRNKIRLMFKEERKKSVTNEAAYFAVAKRADVSARTVRRAVKDSR